LRVDYAETRCASPEPHTRTNNPAPTASWNCRASSEHQEADGGREELSELGPGGGLGLLLVVGAVASAELIVVGGVARVAVAGRGEEAGEVEA
jgi:hypothetical protein